MAARRRIARLKNETIPLREQIVARTQEQVNYMLLGVFDLIRAKQEEYDAYQLYLESIGDYWLRAGRACPCGWRMPSERSLDRRSPHRRAGIACRCGGGRTTDKGGMTNGRQTFGIECVVGA